MRTHTKLTLYRVEAVWRRATIAHTYTHTHTHKHTCKHKQTHTHTIWSTELLDYIPITEKGVKEVTVNRRPRSKNSCSLWFTGYHGYLEMSENCHMCLPKMYHNSVHCSKRTDQPHTKSLAPPPSPDRNLVTITIQLPQTIKTTPTPTGLHLRIKKGVKI